MLSYLALVHHGIESAGKPLTDGTKLARHCLDRLEALGDPKQFPPRLLILLASPAYLDSLAAEQLLKGVTQTFDDAKYKITSEGNERGVELMGCSVAAVFFDRRIHNRGALLVCLASRLLEARVEARRLPDAGPESGLKPGHEFDETISSLLQALNLVTEKGDEIHSFGNRTLFTFFPSPGDGRYVAPRLHEALRAQLGARIPIFGGVASADDPRRVRSGVVFANSRVHRRAIVAANVECGTSLAVSFSQGLTDTGQTYGVAEVDPRDSRVVRRLREDEMADVLEEMGRRSPVPLFADLSPDRDPTVDMPEVESGALRFIREVRAGETLHLLRPEPEKMRQALRDGVERSLKRAFLVNPGAGLGLRCAGLLRHAERIGLDLAHDTTLLEKDLYDRAGRDDRSTADKPFVGGFVDGEAGVDKDGKSVFGNWGSAALVVADELRFRTPVFRGFEKLAEFAGAGAPDKHAEWLDKLTHLVYDIGFPGAMLSLCIRDEDRTAIVARSASGTRYTKVLAEAKPYQFDGEDVLATVARNRQWQFIRDSRVLKCGSAEAATRAGIISQYVTPLVGEDGEVIAVLQIDLGDVTFPADLYHSEKIVLEALGKIVNSGLKRAAAWETAKIIRGLDAALGDCLSAKTVKEGLQQYLEQALKAFGLKSAHIRVAQEEKHSLSLVAGAGTYYEAARKSRREIDFGEVSLTAQAFRDEKIIIVNDPGSHEAHRELDKLLEQREEAALRQSLRAARSYTSVPFKSVRGERGTINLVAPESWFFSWFHMAALEALGERVGVLLETLTRKEREWFLYDVNPRYSQIRDLSEYDKLLETNIKWFAEAVYAEVASLYLLDADRERHILRAQYGWEEKKWVNAAFYRQGEVWTGATAVHGRPRYIPDLHKYYSENRPKDDGTSTHRYTARAFGRDLTPEDTMEAIALELRIADERLGVLTLYRAVKEPGESGFVTTDTRLLQKGADNFASLISILQSDRLKKWRKREHERRQEVYDAMVPDRKAGGGAESFDFGRVCVQVLKSYRAVKARFYEAEGQGEDTPPRCTLKASFRRTPASGECVEESPPPAEEIELVRQTASDNRNNEKRLSVERVRLEEQEKDERDRVALDKLVKRACIPLFSEKKLVGVLDLHWELDSRRAASPDYQHGGEFLLMLGEIIGSAYGRTQTRKKAMENREEASETEQRIEERIKQSNARTRDALQVTSIKVLQCHHELQTIVTEMISLLELLRAARESSPGEADRLIEELWLKLREGDETLKGMMEIGSKMVKADFQPLPLKGLLLSSLEKTRRNYARYKVEVVPPVVPGDCYISADASLIEIVFDNLLDNALKYSVKQPVCRLSVNAEVQDSIGEVTITIEDTGVGMSQEKVRQIRDSDFYEQDGRKTAGVMLSKKLLLYHGGSLAYDSELGKGTKTFITLPLDSLEAII